jgi:hypothetical protein
MDLDRHIWEGWTPQAFIDELEPIADMVFNDVGTFPWQTQVNRQELKEWCMSNQPYYKKYIPEVVNYFAKKYNIL